MGLIYSSNEEVQQACEEWQKVLRLQDWIVKATIERQPGIQKGSSQGCCNWQIQLKMAKISILDPLDYPPDCMIEQDMEQTLVHELLHLHNAPFDNFDYESMENTALEQSIDSIAMALVKLKRGITNV